jgi:hypothetical protein
VRCILLYSKDIRDLPADLISDIVGMIFISEHPNGFHVIMKSPHFRRFNSIAIRSNPNSSSLWRMRKACCMQFGWDYLSEVEFLVHVVHYRGFNYHAFNYWNNIILSECKSSSGSVLVDGLLSVIKTMPSNFSAYHSLLTILKETGYPEDLTGYVIDKFRQGATDMMLESDAYREFIVSLAVELQLGVNYSGAVLQLCQEFLPLNDSYRCLLDTNTQ